MKITDDMTIAELKAIKLEKENRYGKTIGDMFDHQSWCNPDSLFHDHLVTAEEYFIAEVVFNFEYAKLC